MKIVDFAKKALGFWRDRDVHYELNELVETDFLFREISGQRYLTIKKAKSIGQQIVYPQVREGSMWHSQAMSKLISDIDKMFTEDGYFDVCVITGAISTFKLNACPSTGKALEDLRAIHCVGFSDMSPEVFEAIPRYLSHIFTEGRIPVDAVGADAEVELDKSDDKPALAPENCLVRELSDLANDALAALASGNPPADLLDALRARQRQALTRMMGEDA